MPRKQEHDGDEETEQYVGTMMVHVWIQVQDR
jgi:hypothetical protein